MTLASYDRHRAALECLILNRLNMPISVPTLNASRIRKPCRTRLKFDIMPQVAILTAIPKGHAVEHAIVAHGHSLTIIVILARDPDIWYYMSSVTQYRVSF